MNVIKIVMVYLSRYLTLQLRRREGGKRERGREERGRGGGRKEGEGEGGKRENGEGAKTNTRLSRLCDQQPGSVMPRPHPAHTRRKESGVTSSNPWASSRSVERPIK